MLRRSTLLPAQTYHIYVAPNTFMPALNEDGFRSLLTLYKNTLSQAVSTLAYCLLPTHFHFLIRVRTVTEQADYWYENFEDDVTLFEPISADNHLTNFSNQLWQTDDQHPITVTQLSEAQSLKPLIRYIHQNPHYHGLTSNFRTWRWSSYRAILGDRPTQVDRDAIISLFLSTDWFEETHWQPVDLSEIGYLIVND